MSDQRLFDEPAGGPGGDRQGIAVPDEGAPLAARLRPRRLEEVVGQLHLVGPGAPLRAAIESDDLRSVVLWGPPGTGKTTLAHVVAGTTNAAFVQLSAVTAGVKDVRAVLEGARARLASGRRRTVLFLDEIHRFNKAQQDALLPGVEDGSIILIGATTENPSFEVNAPLLSRTLLYRLEPLAPEDVRTLIERALSDPRGLHGVEVDEEALGALVTAADGDARAALTELEAAVGVAAAEPDAAAEGPTRITLETVRTALSRPRLRYDKADDNHYDQASALIKSVRGSDPDAALYWVVRMLTSGEDPRFVARRLVILASEDVGLADPGALEVAVAAFAALDRVGLPEARYALAQAAVYLALAPKSNSLATALARAEEAVERLANAPVPPHLRDASYPGAARLGHGVGYVYPHDDPSGSVEQRYLPEGIEPGELYRPSAHGREPELNAWRQEVREEG